MNFDDEQALALLDMQRSAGAAGAAGTNAPAGLAPLDVPTAPLPPAPAPMPAPSPPALPPPQIVPPASPPSGLSPPIVNPPPPAPPTKNVTDRESTYTTSRTKVDPREIAAQNALQKTNQEQQKNVQQGEKVEEAQNTARQVTNVQKQRIYEQHGEKLSSLVKDADAALAKHQEEYDLARTAYANATPTSLWDGDGGGKRKFWAGVAMALGGLSERDTGHNTGYDMIMGAVDRHAKAEEARISHMKDVVGESEKAMNIALGRKHEALADLSAWKTAALESAAAEMETRMGSLADPEAKAKAQEKILALRKEAEQEKAKFLETTRAEIKNQVITKTQKIVGGAGASAQDKPIGQWKPEERKAEGFAMRAYKAADEMDRYQYNPKDMQVLTNAARREALAGGVTGMADKAWKLLNVSTYNQLSPTGKKRYNATREFIVSGLRPESGAAISFSELADAEQRYGTVPGDNKDTAPQKKQNRMSKVAEVGIQSGRPQFWISTTGAYGPQGGNAPAPSPPTAPKPGGLPPGAVPGTLKGQRGYALNGKFYPLEVAQQ